jgi:hypothetical protein
MFLASEGVHSIKASLQRSRAQSVFSMSGYGLAEASFFEYGLGVPLRLVEVLSIGPKDEDMC